MKKTTLKQFVENPNRFIEAAQLERVLVTRDGKPLAVVLGLENKDDEDLRLEADPEFWRMIEARRKSPTVPLADAEAGLFAEED